MSLVANVLHCGDTFIAPGSLHKSTINLSGEKNVQWNFPKIQHSRPPTTAGILRGVRKIGSWLVATPENIISQ